MTILAIETSCDETAASVVEDGRKVLSHVLASSADMHAKTGGIIPEMAAREQLKSILPVIEEALKKAFPSQASNLQYLSSNLDVLAVTAGPGLIGSLLVGVETAKTLAWLWNKPLIPVNHLVGHIYANFIREFPISNFQFPNEEPKFPALALVVSGGHTDLVLMENHQKITWIGGTRDDAAGEAFDKTARLLGLPYPGGPAIAAEAAKFEAQNPKSEKLQMFPRPLINENYFDWSFSGLKTAVAREVSKNKKLTGEDLQKFSAEIQQAIVDSLVIKTMRAVKKFKPKSLLLGGGVAANSRLREEFNSKIQDLTSKISLHVPPPKFCTDNASMIGAAAFYNYQPVNWRKIQTLPELTITGEI
ncbi:tRNA (adenosine(37)-N6)-threonylcarbamoyltransferase complex transferase subunit TsaD [Candidatus Microgenomates bacterium]|nr:tRNA (adenosine(37)-N6)-threonylcarbamoyltransferase complex transferase subunit TsaD [Candidatus Microgenomates bacterium]